MLRHINFEASERELVCIVGKVGSGKTSLLHAILGELGKISGQVTLNGNLAYVSQVPWL